MMSDAPFSIEEVNTLPFHIFGLDSSQRGTGCNLAQAKTFCNVLKNTDSSLIQKKQFNNFSDLIRGRSINFLSEKFHIPRDTTEKMVAATSLVLRENKSQLSIQKIIDLEEYERELFVCYVSIKKCSDNSEILGFAIDLDAIRDCKQLLSEVNSMSIKNASEFSEYIINFSNHNVIDPKKLSLTNKNALLKPVNISKRELDCIKLLARGMSNSYIAINLNLSRRTVESYIINAINARNKLDCKNSIELVFKCAKLGMI